MKIIRVKLLHLFQREPKTFLPPVTSLGVLSKSLRFMVICVSLVTVLTLQKFLSVRHALFNEVQDWEYVVQLSDENYNTSTMKEKFNSLFASLKLNSSCALSKKRISDCLQHSVPLNCLNLRPTSSKGQSTQYLSTQSGDLNRFSCFDELFSDSPNFDLGILKRNLSPDSNDFLADLSSEFKINNVDSPLKDLFKNASQKRNVLYDVNAEFDFTAGSLNPERLKEYGMNEYALNLVEKGIPVNLSHPLFPGDIKCRRNSKNIQNNFNVIKNLISSLEMAGHVQKVNVRPLVVSPLNVVPKANGSPRLIHDLSLLKRFVQRGPKVRHINVLNLAKKFSSKSYFCKLDLSNGYFHLPIREEDRKYFGFSFDHTYYIFNSLCFGYSPAPEFFQYFSHKIVRILQEQNVVCEVELDDFLIHANSYRKCKKDVELVIYLLSYFLFRINFSKSCLILSQKIDFLGYALDAKNRCFTLTHEKLVKCRLIIKALSLLSSIKVKLLQRILGFFNFACQLVPFFRSYNWPWYRFANLPASYRVRPDPGPLVHLREIFFKGPLFYAWPSRVARCSVTCFVDATNFRVAGISGPGMFSFPLRSSRPILEAEFLASLYGIYSHLPFSNNVRLIGDNTGVLYSVQKGSSRNLISNYFLQNLADLWHKYPFYLTLWYIPSNSNPANFFTRHY